MARFNPFPLIYDPTPTLAVGATPSSLASGDFNGDGILDLAATNSINTVSVLLGNGSGGFGSATNFTIGGVPTSLISGDFNGDGILDLVTANFGYLVSDNISAPLSTVSVLLGNGSGGFSSATRFPVGDYPNSVVSGDFNRDGILDLATANFFSNSVSVLLGNGSGGFGSATNFTAGGDFPTSLISADFNRDGILDLATITDTIGPRVYFSPVSVLLGNGSGGFGSPTNFTVGAASNALISGDFNDDGILDLATTNDSNTVSVLLGNGSGGFGTATNFTAGRGPISLISGDFNGDGILDLATTNYPNTVSVLLGNGSGGFGGATNFPVGDLLNALISGDFDGDGILDLATANGFSNNISVLLNRTPQIVLDTVTRTIDGAAETNNSITVDLNTGSIRVNRPTPITLTFPGYQNITGTQIDDTLTGNTGINQLSGQSGNDILNGNGGNDELIGDRGNDILNGGAGDDDITGSFGDDVLTGDAGVDDLAGGAGNDTYSFNTNSQLNEDLVTDTLGLNTLDFSSTTAQAIVINLSFSDTQTINANLSLTLNNSAISTVNGGSLNDTLTGNNQANTIKGGSGNDVLVGNGGNDELTGGNGNDTLTGNRGANRFTFSTGVVFLSTAIGVDTLTDFGRVATNRIALSKATFTALSSVVGNGFSKAAEFATVSSNAATSRALIVYNSTNGKLFYNQNGAAAGFGGNAGGQFATLNGDPTLNAADFVIQA